MAGRSAPGLITNVRFLACLTVLQSTLQHGLERGLYLGVFRRCNIAGELLAFQREQLFLQRIQQR